ncbi:UdgX family uracil-DNA binding protein [Streptomyces sp. MI02-7b]|uniref:UdgX family uracil-DNA binding protein n=1 Tax=Streptomyces sp. MI02-7b TaxID=462941 RepID=UPI0029AB0A46|nr:UdgX family uracil-DNA binding protein [Streptomyces sp. MI02-7b]MDX3071055.1 UdgX family uracil-DNA binding protein [Streptomyces sp. MI02-7b]
MTAYDAVPYVPDGADVSALREAAAGCRGCPLYADATQTVFGRGESSARAVLVGEQPGDQEDRQGEPFVGPAGKVLTRALDDAGIDPDDVYVTNAVKHFKFTVPERGKRRIHQQPSLREVSACRPWLTAELELIAPQVVVALGATAAKALMGPDFRVTRQRGKLLTPDPPLDGAQVLATVHPSAVLRAGEGREAMYESLVTDLRVVAEQLS